MPTCSHTYPLTQHPLLLQTCVLLLHWLARLLPGHDAAFQFYHIVALLYQKFRCGLAAPSTAAIHRYGKPFLDAGSIPLLLKIVTPSHIGSTLQVSLGILLGRTHIHQHHALGLDSLRKLSHGQCLTLPSLGLVAATLFLLAALSSDCCASAANNTVIILIIATGNLQKLPLKGVHSR